MKLCVNVPILSWDFLKFRNLMFSSGMPFLNSESLLCLLSIICNFIQWYNNWSIKYICLCVTEETNIIISSFSFLEQKINDFINDSSKFILKLHFWKMEFAPYFRKYIIALLIALLFCGLSVLTLQTYTVIYWWQRCMFSKQHFAYLTLLNLVLLAGWAVELKYFYTILWHLKFIFCFH